MASIIWDIKTKGIQREMLPEPCITCGKTESMEVVVGQNYLTIMFIPMFPLGKSTWCTCKSCKKDHVLKQLPASYETVYTKLRQKAKTPWWA